MSGTCSSHANTMKCVRNLWKCVVHHQGWMSQPGTGVIQVSPDKVVVQNTGVPLRENIYKTACICKKGLSYLFSISMLTSLVYFKTCLRMKVSLSLWSIPSQNVLNSLTISQIHMDLSLTGYPQGPPWAHQMDQMITVLSVSECMGSPSAFLPFARREKHKKASTSFEEAAVEVKPLLTPYEQSYLHSYAQKKRTYTGKPEHCV